MSDLTTWHKILMAMAILFCAGFGIRELLTSGATPLMAFYLGAAAALVAYLSWFSTKMRRLEHPEDDPGHQAEERQHDE